MIAAFEKSAQVRFVGHLDLMRAIHRALRRSGLPIRYSQGFNPHVNLSFASPLPVGVSGAEELMDAALERDVTEEAFMAGLAPAMPGSLPLLRVRAVSDGHPKLMARLRTASYTATLRNGGAWDMAAAIPALLAAGSIEAVRKTKSGEKPCDIRPMIHALDAEEAGESVVFTCRVSLTEQDTLKPLLLLETLAKQAGVPWDASDAAAVRLWRLRLYGEKDRLPVPLYDV